ncbi:large conductance mechanosensitive channel protein MscL [Actinacidiphila epipremni]|uniref:Large-conductance mechanosensitive channel n=1 Tax=Actinacidiphila epipremni TaxID=2053013 RepID=A0ABX0ZW21_9ACTN|nr:large conductance mechanosensitive channel protein MscL [Actinacidiphila epipremni]NJP48160.1 large conductance mechanosensitive channel protein MscL [Actinacidiphila epipremni]
MSRTDQPSLLAGFKEFVMRGNVIDLAVAVVIGAAFSSIVNSVVNGIINPLVGAFGTKDLAGYSSCLKGPCRVDSKGETVSGIHILWGSVLSATLTFLITAAVVYFLMVLPMARYLARRAAKQQSAPAEETVVKEEAVTDEITLLRDIRDALVAPRSGGAG